MRKPLGLLLVAIGGILIYQGWSKKESVAGDVATMSAKVANKVDGGTRVADHVWYLAGGVALAVVGAGLVLKK